MKRTPPPPPNRKNPPPLPPSRAPKPSISEINAANQQPQPEANIEQLREPQRPQSLGTPNSSALTQPEPVTSTQDEVNINNQAALQEQNLEQASMEQELQQPNNQNIQAQKQVSFPIKSMIPPKMAPPPSRGKVPAPKNRGVPPPPTPKITIQSPETVQPGEKQEDSNVVPEKKEQEQFVDKQLEQIQKTNELPSNTAKQPQNPRPLPTRKNVQVPPPLKNSPKGKIPPSTFNPTPLPKIVQQQQDEIPEDMFKPQEQEAFPPSTSHHQQQPQKVQLVEQKPISADRQTNEHASIKEEKQNSNVKNPLLQKLKKLQQAKEEMTKQYDATIQENNQSDSIPQRQEIYTSTIERTQETVKAQTQQVTATVIKSQQKTPTINRKVPGPPSTIKNLATRPIPEPIVKQLPVPETKQQPLYPQQVQAELKIVPQKQPDNPSTIHVALPNPPPNSPMLIQINSLLERYHNVKAFYLSNLKELDEQLNFHRQQEEAEVEKINHLIAELSKKNEKIKELCQITTSNNAFEAQQFEEAAV